MLALRLAACTQINRKIPRLAIVLRCKIEYVFGASSLCDNFQWKLQSQKFKVYEEWKTSKFVSIQAVDAVNGKVSGATVILNTIGSLS